MSVFWARLFGGDGGDSATRPLLMSDEESRHKDWAWTGPRRHDRRNLGRLNDSFQGSSTFSGSRSGRRESSLQAASSSSSSVSSSERTYTGKTASSSSASASASQVISWDLAEVGAVGAIKKKRVPTRLTSLNQVGFLTCKVWLGFKAIIASPGAPGQAPSASSRKLLKLVSCYYYYPVVTSKIERTGRSTRPITTPNGANGASWSWLHWPKRTRQAGLWSGTQGRRRKGIENKRKNKAGKKGGWYTLRPPIYSWF